jgi:hypothetical protein
MNGGFRSMDRCTFRCRTATRRVGGRSDLGLADAGCLFRPTGCSCSSGRQTVSQRVTGDFQKNGVAANRHDSPERKNRLIFRVWERRQLFRTPKTGEPPSFLL